MQSSWLARLAVGIAALCAAPTLAQQPAPDVNPAAALEKAVIGAVAKVGPSVVAIARVRSDQPRDAGADRFDELPGIFTRPQSPITSEPSNPDFVPQEYGTGVVIDAAGLILTTHHVVGDPTKNSYFVYVQRRPYVAKVLAADPWMDLAVLKLEGASDLKPIAWGDSKSLRKGQFVIALGNPLAIAKDGEASAAAGLISNLQRAPALAKPRASLPSGRETLHHYGNLIETDARLQRGTSGGALVNLTGEMIGLITLLAAQPEEPEPGGFAIPIDQPLRDTVEKLKTGRRAEYGFLGVAPAHLSDDERRAGQKGARVYQVVPGTPAAAAALRDEYSGRDFLSSDIITHVAGEEVSDANHLILLLSRMPAESQVKLTIARRDAAPPAPPRTLQKTVKLAKKYADTLRAEYATVIDPAWRGLTLDYHTATPNYRDRLRAIDPDGCLVITGVERDSPAWKAGLRPGMFISHVGEKHVTSPSEFRAAVAGQAGAVQLHVTEPIRDSTTITVGA